MLLLTPVKISLVCPRDEIPTDSINRKMLNVYVEDGHCTQETSAGSAAGK